MDIVKTCLLCGSDARSEPKDHGNCISVRCGSLTCGDYEISLAASRRLEGNMGLAKRLAELANEARKSKSVLEILIGPHNEISTNLLPLERV